MCCSDYNDCETMEQRFDSLAKELFEVGYDRQTLIDMIVDAAKEHETLDERFCDVPYLEDEERVYYDVPWEHQPRLTYVDKS